MMRFKRPEERVPSILMLASVVILAGCLLYMLFVSAPSVAGLAKGRENSRRQIEHDIERAGEDAKLAEKAMRPRLWKGNADAITSQVMEKVTQQTRLQKVSMTAFRPQRPQMHTGLIELAYSVNLSGSYPAVRAVIASFDAPGGKLALRSIQMASTDAATSAVTATVGISAYAEVVEAPVAKTGKGDVRDKS